jgi:hypothetical protein
VREAQPPANAEQGGDRASILPAIDDPFAQNGQDRQLAFVNLPVDRRTTTPDRLSMMATDLTGLAIRNHRGQLELPRQ